MGRWLSLALALALCLGTAQAQQVPQGQAVLNQGFQARALTKSDTASVLATRGVYVGDAAPCTIAVLFNGDSAAVSFTNAQPGAIYPFSIIKLMSTNTTCASVVALY